MDSSCRIIALRSSVVIGLAAAVATILYFTPLPDQFPQSCSRKCHELDWPMICRIKLTLERFQTLSEVCRSCPANKTDCFLRGCITVDGRSRGILTANRQFPGPTIQVCQHDIIVVDIVNRVPGQSFGVHWRGQPQIESPYMDGVPMITQCPIPSLTTFQYKFRATESGTQMWQVNTGEEFLDTLFGPLIVKKPDSKEIHRKLYDTDDSDNVAVIHSWNPQRVNFLFEDDKSHTKLLINGKTQENGVPPHIFKVSTGKRHRFRVMYMGGADNCEIRLHADNHKFLVIALDGHPIEPKLVTSATLYPGERLDMVLHANKKIASYHMRVDPVDCPNVKGTYGIIEYDGVKEVVADENGDELSLNTPEITEMRTIHDEDCANAARDSMDICLTDIRATDSTPEELTIEPPHSRLYFFYDATTVSAEHTLNTSIVGIRKTVKVPRTNNLTMMLPSSPLISQANQIAPDNFCNVDSVPYRCKENSQDICECVHIVNIPINAVVELVLVNQDKIDHVFHLHGYSFRVIGASILPSSKTMPDHIKYLDHNDKLLARNYESPVLKDTVALVSNGVIALRFKADNPGYWLLDEEHLSHWSKGMGLVLRVGENSDLSPIPNNFPKCGDWVGPQYFLI